MRKWLVSILIAGTAILVNRGAGAEDATGDYAIDLGRVYGGYQRMLARKEACDSAVPATRAANDKAFAAWQQRHQALIQDLQRRVTAMIRLASKDDKDYARNFGRYEGEIVKERKEYRDSLLALGAEELRRQCQRMPEVLKEPGADLRKVYAAELETIGKRK